MLTGDPDRPSVTDDLGLLTAAVTLGLLKGRSTLELDTVLLRPFNDNQLPSRLDFIHRFIFSVCKVLMSFLLIYYYSVLVVL